MLNTDHCNLCDNKIMDFKLGAMCGLTSKKPDFHQKCNVIKLDKEFKTKIEAINIEYEAVKKTKVDTYGIFIFYLLIALAIIATGYLIGKYALESGVVSTVPLVIMGTGIAPLGMAFGRLNHYRTHINIATKKKKKLDTISQMYGYQYTIDIEHLKDSLGNLSYNTDLKLRRTSNTVS